MDNFDLSVCAKALPMLVPKYPCRCHCYHNITFFFLNIEEMLLVH